VPVCDRCKSAYGDHELHICESIRRRLPRAIIGAGLGAAIGVIGVTLSFGFMSGSPQSGLLGIFVGGPVGAVIGVMIGLATARGERFGFRRGAKCGGRDASNPRALNHAPVLMLTFRQYVAQANRPGSRRTRR
jgi:hypothetical protein